MRNTPPAELLDGTAQGMLNVRVAVYLNRKFENREPTPEELEALPKDLIKVFKFEPEEANELVLKWWGGC